MADTSANALDAFKAKYPQYKDVPDGELAKQIYEQQYAQKMTWGQFTDAIGYSPEPTLPAQAPKDSTLKLAYRWNGNLPEAAPPSLQEGTQPVAATLGAMTVVGLDALKTGRFAQGAAEWTWSGIDHALTSALFRTDELGTELWQSLPGHTQDPNLNQETARAIEAGSYTPTTPEAKQVAATFAGPARLLHEVTFAVTHPIQKAAGTLAESTQSAMQAENPYAAAATGAFFKSTPALLGIALTTDNPLTRGMTEATAPIREGAGMLTRAVKSASRDVLSRLANQTETFRYQVADAATMNKLRQLEPRMYEREGQQLLLDHDAAHILAASQAQLTDADRAALERYYEDPTGTYPLTDKQKAFASLYLDPIRKEVGMQQGYVPRVSLEHANFESGAIRGHMEARPKAFRHQATKVDSYKSRGWYRLAPVDNAGEDLVAHFKQYQNPEYPNQFSLTALRNGEQLDFPTQRVVRAGEDEGAIGNPVGGTVQDLNGRVYRVEDATREEITRHSGRQFVQDPVYTMVRTWHQIKTAELTTAQVDDAKSLLADHIRTQDKALPGDRAIESRFFKGDGNTPLYAPPPVARVIEAFMGNPRNDSYLLWRSFNNAILNASFVVPVWHDLNMASLALEEKFPRMLEGESWSHYGSAMHEVLNVSGHYRELIGKGYPFWRPRIFAQTLHETAGQLIKEMGTERAAGLLAKAGIPLDVARKGLAWYRDNVIHSVGPISDALTLSAIKERMALYKEDLDTAANKVFRAMPQYRIRPTQAMLHALQESGVFWFLPYHVDRLRILWNRVKGAAGGNVEDMTRLAGNIMMASIIYPRLDQALRESTNSPNAHVERFGSDRIVADTLGALHRTEPDARLMADLFSENNILSSLYSIPVDAYRAKRKPSAFASEWGEVPPYPSHLDQLKIAGKDVPIYPVENIARTKGDLKSAAAAQFGVFIPPTKPAPF